VANNRESDRRGRSHGRSNEGAQRSVRPGRFVVLAAALVAVGCSQVDLREQDAVAASVQHLSVLPPRPVSSVALASGSVPGGGTVTGTVTLTGTDGTTAVALTVDLPGVASVPAQIQVPSGLASGSFTIATSGVSAATTVRITASAGGASAFVDLQLLPTTIVVGASAVIADPGCLANTLAANDDLSTPAVTLPAPVNFFGTTYTYFYINNNGNVTFQQPLSTFTPFTITASVPPIIAPFFADVDTRGSGSSPVTYSFGPVQYAGRPAMCVNWVNVGYFSNHYDKLNSFQLLLVDRGDVNPGDFDIVMNYDRIAWETGDASGGVNGFGGTPAGAGYSAGNGNASQFYEFPGSKTAGAFLDSNANSGLTHTSRNTLTPGRHIFEVRNGVAPAGGAIGGTVTDSAPSPHSLAGAPVQVCRASDGHCVYLTMTGSLGQYEATGLAPGDYFVTAFSPAGSSLAQRTVGPIHVTAGSAQRVDIALGALTGLPAGVSLTPSRGTAGGLVSLYWRTPIELRASACTGGTSTYTITGSSGALFASGAMSEVSPGTFSATVPPFYPNHGLARVRIQTTCPSGATETVEFDIYIDPSGLVRTVQGIPITGAVVTLFRSDAAAGPFVAVPDGSAVMSAMNRSNPDLTDSIGHFGWDVITGFYKVRAQADGCLAPTGGPFVETAVLPVPPAVTDLDLRLDCPDTTAPVTTAVPSSAPNAAGWYRTAPVVALSAVDEAGGSGVASVRYALSGAQTANVTVAGSAAQVTVQADGSTSLSFGATDNAGNVETAQTLAFKLDSTAPSITCTASPGVISSSSQGLVAVHVDLATSDGTSGIASVALTSIESSVPLAAGDLQTFAIGQASVDGALRAGPQGRTYTLGYTATDVAGNSASCSVTVVAQVVVVDSTAPGCTLTRVVSVAGGGGALEFTVADAGSGLASVSTVSARGGTVSVPAFSSGATGPVVVTAALKASSASESVTLEVADVSGNKTRCAATLLKASKQARTASASDVLASQTALTVYNGTPGARSIEAQVNGKERELENLKDGVVRTIDLSSQLKAGNANRVSVSLDDSTKGSADVLIWQGPTAQVPPHS
jgi:hypothetical protein